MEAQALVVQDGPSKAMATTATDTFMNVIASAARDPQVDVQKMQQLLEMVERVKAREAEVAFSQAMRSAQAEMLPVFRDAENPHARSRYARLETIDAAIRPVYTRHGFSLSFNSGEASKPGAAHIICDVLHDQGHSKRYELEGDLDVAGAQGKSNKTSIQGLGSTVSYLRRYLTLMIFNLTLTNEDNDGSGGSAEAARKVAEEKLAAARDGRTYQPPQDEDFGPPPAPPTDDMHLGADATERSAAGRRAASKFDVLKAFRELKTRYQKIDKEKSYYAVLGRYGMEKSSQFPDSEEGRRQARACYKDMSLNVADLEAYVAQHRD